MEEELNGKKIIYVFLVGVVLTFLVFGLTYAWFSYGKEGTKTTTLAVSNAVKLHYQEGANQINIPSGLPMDDARGKTQTDYFEFTVTGETSTFAVPYIIAARVSTIDANRIPSSYITVYLTEVNNGEEQQVILTTYDELEQVSKNNHIEEKLYDTVVPVNTSNYTKTYRLRLWINTTADYTPTEENGVQIYPMQGKELALTVNVYTEADPVSCDTATVGDKYCFDTECFVVIDSECSNTVLLAEKTLDFATDDYCEKTGLQDPSRVWYKESYVNYCPVNQYDTEYSDDIVDLSAIENQIGPGKTYDGDFDQSTDTPYPYVYNYATDTSVLKDYVTLISNQHYNIPASATFRLPSYEELDKVKDNPAFLSYNPDHYDYVSILTGSVGERTNTNPTTFGLYAYDLYDQSFDTSYSASIKPVMVIPTRDLPASALTTSFLTKHMITYYATTFENKFSVDIDSMNIEYNIVDGYIDNTNLDGHVDELNDNRLFVNINRELTDQELVQEYKKIFNYIKTEVADDGKLYSNLSTLTEINIDSLNVNNFYAKLFINGANAEIRIGKEWENRWGEESFPTTYYVRITVEI